VVIALFFLGIVGGVSGAISGAISAQGQELQRADQILQEVNRIQPKAQAQTPACPSVDCTKSLPSSMQDLAHPPIARISRAKGVPPYSRVVILGDASSNASSHVVRVLYADEKSVHEAEIPKSAVLKTGERVSTRDELDAFLREAHFQIKLARGLQQQNRVPDFGRMLDRVESSLACIEKNRARLDDTRWNAFVDGAKSSFLPVPENRPETIERFVDQFYRALDPKAKGRDGVVHDLRSRTLYVPISMKWIDSTPELKRYFEKSWVGSQPAFDLKIRGGDSGEGISQYGEAHPSEMDFYLSKLVEMKNAILKMKNPALLKTPEFQWLSKIDASATQKYDRMIFIHQNTWDSESTGWQDYIPVDQSFGPVAANPILSVLIHETNVNSIDPGFLPKDSHSPAQNSWAIWGCVGKTVSLEKINSSIESQYQAMAIEPQLGSVYLGMWVPKLAQAADCR